LRFSRCGEAKLGRGFRAPAFLLAVAAAHQIQREGCWFPPWLIIRATRVRFPLPRPEYPPRGHRQAREKGTAAAVTRPLPPIADPVGRHRLGRPWLLLSSREPRAAAPFRRKT